MKTKHGMGAVVLALVLCFGGLSGSPLVRGDVWEIAEAVEKGNGAEADALFKALDPESREMALELLRPEPRQAKIAPTAANVAKARFLLRHSTLARDIAHAARALPPGEVTDKALAAAAPEAKPTLLLLRALNADPSVPLEKGKAKRAFEEWLAGAPTEADLIFLRTDPAMRALADLQKPLLPLLIQRGLATEDEIMLAFRSIPVDRPSQAADFWAEHCHRLSNPPFYPHRNELAKAQLESNRFDLVETLVVNCPPAPGQPDRVDWNHIRIKLRLAQGDEVRMEEAVLEGLREAQAQADKGDWNFARVPRLLADAAFKAGKGDWLDALLSKGVPEERAGIYWRATHLSLDRHRGATERVGERLQGIQVETLNKTLRDGIVADGVLMLEKAGRHAEAKQLLQKGGGDTLPLRGRVIVGAGRYDEFDALLRDPATSPLDGAKALLNALEILAERKEWDRLLQWTENPERFIPLGEQLFWIYKIPTARILALKETGRADEAVAFYFQEFWTCQAMTDELTLSADLLRDAPGFTPALRTFLDGLDPEKTSQITFQQLDKLMRAQLTAEQQGLMLQAFARLEEEKKIGSDLIYAYLNRMPYPTVLAHLETLVPRSPAQQERWMVHALSQAQRGKAPEKLETLQAFFDFIQRAPGRLSLELAGKIERFGRKPELKKTCAGFFADVLRKGAGDPALRAALYGYWTDLSDPRDHPDLVRLFAKRDLGLLLQGGVVPNAKAVGILIERAIPLKADAEILASLREYQGKSTNEETLRILQTILDGRSKTRN